MGRESRQTRRARERREQELRRKHPAQQSRNWTIIGGIVVVVAAVLLFGGFALANSMGGNKTNVAGQIPTPVEAPGKVIDGVVGCDPGMATAPAYHVHMHLSIFDQGKPVTVPAQIGFNIDHDCLYWLHTHDTSGIIHLESPHALRPTLGNFFDVWGQPLSRSRVASAAVKSGQTMRVFVDQKPDSGNPRNIALTRHATITIEVGPPFVAPKPFPFGQL